MLCNGCGKQIPFVGDVCPYCQRGKTRAQLYHLAGYGAAFVGAFIGWKIGGGWAAVTVFAAVLIAVNVFLGLRDTRPPEHRQR
jgi:predicted amidophosphoribosyltransferase